ncbi:MAG TPA: hypothetical protein VFH91_00435 [Pyrinomonadaceae bacterium]|nr:hypothetical protein [Pyrinomonadaceae bacterium]
MSAGEFFDLIRPAAIVLAALISGWVLASARKRFPTYIAFIWTAGTLFLPLIVFPLYLAILLIWRRPARTRKWRVSLPFIYSLVVLSVVGIYFYRDYRSVDAHLARATQARLKSDRGSTISELQSALALEDDAHTHKLLALEFFEVGYLSEAISEYRLAEKGGEPDDSIHFQLGIIFERLNQLGQARLEYQQFLSSSTCLTVNPRCESARHRLREITKQ